MFGAGNGKPGISVNASVTTSVHRVVPRMLQDWPLLAWDRVRFVVREDIPGVGTRDRTVELRLPKPEGQ
jgi:hypothetical protein